MNGTGGSDISGLGQTCLAPRTEKIPSLPLTHLENTDVLTVAKCCGGSCDYRVWLQGGGIGVGGVSEKYLSTLPFLLLP